MSTPLSILVTDVNHHIRDFLKREFQQEGHTVFLARNGSETRRILGGKDGLDCLILDPEIPDFPGMTVLSDLLEHRPTTVVIAHTYREVYDSLKNAGKVQFVEKNSGSVGPLMEKIRECACRLR